MTRIWTQLISIIVRKELVDGFRDRRALLSALAFPLFSPIFVALMFTTIAQDNATPPILDIPVVGAEHAPGLVSFLTSAGAEVVAPPEDPEGAVASGDVPVVVVIDPSYRARFREAKPARVSLLVDSSRNANRATVSRVKRLLDGWANRTAVQRLVVRGVDPSLLRPLDVVEQDQATPQQRAANLLDMLVMMSVMAAFLGSMYLAMDSTAGERERRSLEPLLSLPVPRSVMVLGKFIAATVFGCTGVVLATTTMVFAMNLTPLELLGVRVVLTVPSALALCGILLPLVPVAASLQLLVAAGATSFKEAQTWLSMTLFVPMMPGMVMTVRPVNPQTWMALVPGLSQQVLSGKILRGDGVEVLDVVLLLVSSGTLTTLALVGLTMLFNRERILRQG